MDKHSAPPIESPPAAAATSARGQLRRWLWLGAGFLMVGLGIVGILLPIMPTTVFFIAAAACFARSSPRFERWVLELPHIGPIVRDYRNGLGMWRRTKWLACGCLVFAVTLSSLAISSWAARGIAWGIGLIGIWYIVARVPTRERVLAERERLARQGPP